MNKIFVKLYKDLVMTNYFIFKYNARLESGFEGFEEDIFSGIDIPN